MDLPNAKKKMQYNHFGTMLGFHLQYLHGSKASAEPLL